MAAVLVLEPIFEADLQPEQYAYRPGKSALDAIRHVHALLNTGHSEVLDADLSGYFDSIPHPELMKTVARRISDKAMLHLLKVWLVAPVEEIDEKGRRRRTTRNRDERRGTPQGAPISPLLSNLYMRRFVLGWKVLGHERRLDAHIVNYADDFVICCRGSAAQALAAVQTMMAKLRLTVNETKTRICRGPDEPFDFLGYTFGRLFSPRTGGSYIGERPSAKSLLAICQEIREQTGRRWLWLSEAEVVRRLNSLLRGWMNYFRLGTLSRAYSGVQAHARFRLRQWLARKHVKRGRLYTRYPDNALHDRLGLVRLQPRRANVSCAPA